MSTQENDTSKNQDHSHRSESEREERSGSDVNEQQSVQENSEDQDRNDAQEDLGAEKNLDTDDAQQEDGDNQSSGDDKDVESENKTTEVQKIEEKNQELALHQNSPSGAKDDTPPDVALKMAVRKPLRYGILFLLIGFVVFVIWGGHAPIDSAAVASGHIITSGKNKTIQHLEGGIVRDIFVEDGDLVTKGMVLAKLEDARPLSELLTMRERVLEFEIIEARLTAERDGKVDLVFSKEVTESKDEDIIRVASNQQALFKNRAKQIKGEIDIQNTKIHQYNDKIKGYKKRLSTLDAQLSIVRTQLKSTKKLLDKGLARRSETNSLKTEVERLLGSYSEIETSIFNARDAISETKLEILNIQNKFMHGVMDALKDTQAQLYEATAREFQLQDVLDRTHVKSPIDGVITDLQLHTVGGVLAPGGKILDIVPSNSKLIIQAYIKTQDIDHIYTGLETKIQLNAFKSRLMPRVTGVVKYVSADKVVDERGTMITNPNDPREFYRAEIELDPGELEKINMEIKLQPGMPVTVFLVKGERTFLEYLISPILDSLHKAFKEV